eukprot:scaffold5486_cov282-Ochromonas_danica.AAC.4
MKKKKSTTLSHLFHLFLLLLAFYTPSLHSDTSSTTTSSSSSYDPSHFDWQGYLLLYPDLLKHGITTEKKLREHYENNGRKEGRRFISLYPSSTTRSLIEEKLKQFIITMEGKGRSYYDRSLIIYHIHKVDDVLPMEVLVNNVLIFQSALYDDSSSGSSRGSVQGSGTFCLFNIISETELHPLMKYLDTNQTTRGLAIWSASPGETYSHLMTLKWLSTFIKQNFATVFFTSSYVRGPLAGREDGRWISQFRKPLVMLKTTMLGAVRQCSGSGSGEGGGGGSGEGSVVTSHFYGIQTKILTDLLKKWQPVQDLLTDMTTQLPSNQLQHTLQQHQQRQQQLLSYAYDHMIYRIILEELNLDVTSLSPPTTTTTTSGNSGSSNSGSGSGSSDLLPCLQDWCDVNDQEALFVPWKGESTAFLCKAQKRRMKVFLRSVEKETRSLNLRGKIHVNEVLRGGALIDLYKQYKEEVDYPGWLPSTSSSSSQWDDNYQFISSHYPLPTNVTHHSLKQGGEDSSGNTIVLPKSSYFKDGQNGNLILHRPVGKVCFVMHSNHFSGTKKVPERLMSTTIVTDLLQSIQSLFRQSDGHWQAFYLLDEEDSPIVTILRTAVSRYNDSRLTLLSTSFDDNRRRRLQSSKENRDAESCHILDTIVQAGLDQEDCDYLTFSSLGNIYGHEVVANLRLQATVSKPLLKMMFIPMNSHHYLDLDDSLRKLMKNWEQRCIGLYTQTQINLLACTVQPRPVKGRVDLSAVFFHRNSLKQEGGHFPATCTNQFQVNQATSEVDVVRCLPCEGDSLVEYLATQRMWTYDRLPIDGIQSMVFLHPSPLWCLASGNVWYAPPFGYDPRCYSQATAEKLRRQEQRGSSSSGGGSNARRKLDWEHFDSTQRLCLRHKP